ADGRAENHPAVRIIQGPDTVSKADSRSSSQNADSPDRSAIGQPDADAGQCPLALQWARPANQTGTSPGQTVRLVFHSESIPDRSWRTCQRTPGTGSVAIPYSRNDCGNWHTSFLCPKKPAQPQPRSGSCPDVSHCGCKPPRPASRSPR